MIVSLTAYDRPEYLAEVLEALAEADSVLPEPVFLTAQIDPGKRTDEVWDLLQGFREGRGVWINVNEKRIGCPANVAKAVAHGFTLGERLGEDYVFHLEDDFVLSPDALLFAAYLRDGYERDSRVLFTGSFRHCHHAEGSDWTRYGWSDYFSVQGWGTWRDRWEATILPIWDARDKGERGYVGWDWNVQNMLMGGRGPWQMVPYVSRVRHIGLEGGVHTTPLTFENDLPGLFCEEVPDGEYWFS